MKLTNLGIALCLLALFYFVSHNGGDKNNLYTIHTKGRSIKCNYHNSRDAHNGRFSYHDHVTDNVYSIEVTKVDSISIHQESDWTSGPKHKDIKYVDLR